MDEEEQQEELNRKFNTLRANILTLTGIEFNHDLATNVVSKTNFRFAREEIMSSILDQIHVLGSLVDSMLSDDEEKKASDGAV